MLQREIYNLQSHRVWRKSQSMDSDVQPRLFAASLRIVAARLACVQLCYLTRNYWDVCMYETSSAVVLITAAAIGPMATNHKTDDCTVTVLYYCLF
jgi:hypothetical protein